MEIINRNTVTPFITMDGSEIREILSPRNSLIQKQSLAEAVVKPGQVTHKHVHEKTEEIYYVLRGKGRIRIEEESSEVNRGDGIVILPGKLHTIENIGSTDLVFLCCCAPAYEHEDTTIIT